MKEKDTIPDGTNIVKLIPSQTATVKRTSIQAGYVCILCDGFVPLSQSMPVCKDCITKVRDMCKLYDKYMLESEGDENEHE